MSSQERWQVGERPALDIRVPVGAIEVYAGDAGVIQLTVDGGEISDLDIFKIGDRLSVRHPSRWRMRGRNSRILVNVPIGTDVEVTSTAGDIRLIGRLGIVRVHAASGSVEMGDAARRDVTTASGDGSGGEIAGDATISSVSGECTLKRVGANLVATLTSGDLRADDCAGDVTVGSMSGNVRIGRCCGSAITVRSISGDVRVGLPSGIRVEAEISTLSGRAVLPEPAPRADHGDRRPVRLQLKSVSGDLRVERTS